MTRTGTAPGASWSFPPPTCTSWRAVFSPTTGPSPTRERSRWASVWLRPPALPGTVRMCQRAIKCVVLETRISSFTRRQPVSFSDLKTSWSRHPSLLQDSLRPTRTASASWIGACLRPLKRWAMEAWTCLAPHGLADLVPTFSPVYSSQLLTSSAVHKWGTEIHEGIYNMLMLLVELVAERVKQDPVPVNLMGVLTMVCVCSRQDCVPKI